MSFINGVFYLLVLLLDGKINKYCDFFLFGLFPKRTEKLNSRR
jgi:hypothetical protein